MKRLSRVTKVGVTAALAAAGIFLATGATYAGASYTSYDEIMPIGSVPALDGGQTKAVTNQSGNINVATVGASYTIRGNLQTVIGGGGWTWTAPLVGGNSATLPNSMVSGADAYLAVRVATFNTVQVQSTGTWRSN